MASYVNALNENNSVIKSPELVTGAAGGAAPAGQTTPYTTALAGASQPAAVAAPSAPQQTATYIDNSGKKQTGYVSALSNDSNLSYWQRMEKYYNDQYEAAVASNNAAAKAKYEAAMEQISHKIQSLETAYQGTNRQLYRDYKQSERVLPQQMAAQGYSGGLTESSRLRLSNSYEEALAQNEREKAGQIADLNAQGVQYQYDADAEAARLNAEADQQRRSYLTALAQQEREEGLAQAREIGDTTGDYSGLSRYGYTASQIANFRKAWIAANPQLAAALGYIKASGSGGGSSGGRRRRPTSGDDKKNNNSGSGLSIDYNSILGLGRGPISASTLSGLVSSGAVTETVKNNKVTYANNTSKPATNTKTWQNALSGPNSYKARMSGK